MTFNVIDVLDWAIDKLLAGLLVKLGTFMIAESVSILGFSVAITILIIVIGAVLLRV